MKQFKLKSICLGTRSCSSGFRDVVMGVPGVDWIETAVEYGNDYWLGRMIPKKAKVISRISSLAEWNIVLEDHLVLLRRPQLDILLLDPNHGDWEEYLPELWESGYGVYFKELGISGVTEKEQIWRFQKLTGHMPDWISVDLCPLRFPFELLQEAADSGIHVISYGILGGRYKEQEMIQEFSLPFLTGFAATYSDIVCIGTREVERTWNAVRCLQEWIGRKMNGLDEKNFELTKNIGNSRPAPIDPKIHLYVTIEGNVFKLGYRDRPISVGSGGMISFAPFLQYITKDTETELDKYLKEGLKIAEMPVDMDLPGEKVSYLRYTFVSLLMTKYPSWWYRYEYVKDGNDMTGVVIKKRWPIPFLPKRIGYMFGLDYHTGKPWIKRQF